MKRNVWFLMVSLFLVIVFGGSLCFAQDDGEKGLAKEEWMYQSLDLLFRDGLLNNYPHEWVAAGNRLSRFEVAYYIKQLLGKNNTQQGWEKTLPPQALLALQRLITEFRGELSDLGIQTTDIGAVSPSLASSDNLQRDEYQDLDQILAQHQIQPMEPYYYYGQYYKNFDQKSFLFIPSVYITGNDLNLLDDSTDTINIVSQSSLESSPTFLVVKGVLPVSGSEPVSGYYLFPLNKEETAASNSSVAAISKLDSSVLGLLDEVDQLQQVEYLWRMQGTLPLEGYLRLNSNLQSVPLFGSLNQGLKIGGLLIYSENTRGKLDQAINDFGLPYSDANPAVISNVVDLDNISSQNWQSLQISLQGMVPLSTQTSILGGLDFVYRETGTGVENLWPSEAKASAGLFYRINDYWTLLTYQSLVNSQLKNGLLSTTSVGVSYNDWISFWLAYQFLDLNDSTITGSVKLRF